MITQVLHCPHCHGIDKDQMVEMAMNASGIQDTARVLHVSPTTVINELKKRHLHCTT